MGQAVEDCNNYMFMALDLNRRKSYCQEWGLLETYDD